MKTKIIAFFMFLLAVLPINALVSSNGIKVEDKKDIELKGTTEDDRKKSLILPFGAYRIDNTEVCVMSYDFCSNATICILDTSGQTMDYFTSSLSSLQVVSFDINGYPSGTYTLAISTPQGTYLTGMFEVNL